MLFQTGHMRLCNCTVEIPGMVLKLILAGIIAMTLQSSRPNTANALSHQAWDEILRAYITQSPDGINRFDYGALKSSLPDSARLAVYINSFADADIDALDDNAQFAAYANAYNALTIQHIIQRYPVKSIRSGSLTGPWKRVKMVINGKDVSLDAIEHDILRAQYEDPRVHYAVNCASYGCPNLQIKAWAAETLDADLDAAARDFINHPRAVRVHKRGGLHVSSIYVWFKEDFGGNNQGVINHLLEYAEPELAAAIRANPQIRSDTYDWSLNDVE